GLAPGSVTITATTAGASGTATLSVQQVLTSVVVSPATATLNALGLTQSFSAVARDAGGNVILGRTFAWSASPAGVATIDPGTGDRVRGYHGGHRWSHGKRHAVDRADGGVGGREPGHGGTGRPRGHTAVDRDRERRERQCHSWPVVHLEIRQPPRRFGGPERRRHGGRERSHHDHCDDGRGSGDGRAVGRADRRSGGG